MNNLVMIKIKDICYYDDDFEYDPFFVIKEKDFENKYKQLETICKNYNDFQEVEDFIHDNFKKVEVEKYTIEI